MPKRMFLSLVSIAWSRGGGPPLTMVHIFDYPAEFLDDPVKRVLSGFGDDKSIKHQKYIGRSGIETGTRLVLMAFRVVPPHLVNIDGFFCRLWYKGQPLICNLCNLQGHKSVDCPNRDKCRRCGESGHFARSCPNAWSSLRSSNATPASVVDFPPLPPAPRPSVGEPSSAPAAVSLDIDNIVDEACDSLLDDLSSSSVSSGDSDASSVEDSPTKGGAPDVNSNADSSFCDLNDNSRNNKAIDKSNDIVNVNSLVNADARSSSKASAVVSGASVYSNLSTVDAAGGFGSSILVDGSNDKDSTAATNDELDADGPPAARASGENVHNVLSATQNSGVNVNTEVNIGGGDVVVGNKEGSAIGGAPGLAGNVNPGSLATASAMLGGSPENGTVTTEVLSSGYVNSTSEVGDFLMDVNASLNAGLFGPDSEVDCSLNDAQILSPSSECPESQSILLGISKVVDGSGPSCAAGPSPSVGDGLSIITDGTGPSRVAGASSFDGDTLSVTGVAQAVSGGGVPECRVGNDRPPPSSLDGVVSERAPRGLLSRCKAKPTASRSINKLRDMVAPAIFWAGPLASRVTCLSLLSSR